VERAFGLLRCFTDQERVWALADLSRRLRLARPTTLRLLGALEREGMVQRTSHRSSYRLGPRAIQLGALAQRSNELPVAAQAQLEELARRTGETASLEVLADHEIMVLAEVRGRFRGSASERVGARWPAHAAATGKVLLAAALEEEGEVWERFLASARRLPRYTERTITSLPRFRAALARVTRDDYSVALEELERGYVAIGAPVRDQDGRVVAALCLGGPASRLSPQRLPALIRRVREAAKRVSLLLGNPEQGVGHRGNPGLRR
jgi:DNA-binding IclR family transcriptional regulator